MSGARTYNASTGVTDIGFVRITASSFSAIRCDFIEFFLTSQLVECNGSAEAQFDIKNFTNISQSPRSMVENNGQCIFNIQKMLAFYPDSSAIVNNNNLMQFNVGAWQCETNGSNFVTNTSRFQARIGFFVSNGSGNTFILALLGDITGLEIGSIRMNGNGNTGIIARGPVLMNVGQIFSTNTGNTGILVEDPGQLYGRVSRIMMQDMSCIEFRSTRDSNITFDWMTNKTNSYVIVVNESGEVTMGGNSITAEEVKYPILITAAGSKFNLKLVRMDIISCAAGIYIEADNSDINIDIQHFNINGDATHGIYASNGRLTLSGNYFMETASASSFITLDNRASLKANLGFVDVNNIALSSTTRGNIWYESSETNSSNGGTNVIMDMPDPSQIITLKGLFSTGGDSNVVINNSAVSFIRVLDGIYISRSRNIVSGTGINIVCNYSIGNAGLSGVSPVPGGSFIVDPSVQ
jgi:hypothetical protein